MSMKRQINPVPERNQMQLELEQGGRESEAPVIANLVNFAQASEALGISQRSFEKLPMRAKTHTS